MWIAALLADSPVVTDRGRARPDRIHTVFEDMHGGAKVFRAVCEENEA